jgi:hypothetical protein
VKLIWPDAFLAFNGRLGNSGALVLYVSAYVLAMCRPKPLVFLDCAGVPASGQYLAHAASNCARKYPLLDQDLLDQEWSLVSSMALMIWVPSDHAEMRSQLRICCMLHQHLGCTTSLKPQHIGMRPAGDTAGRSHVLGGARM